KAIKDVKEITTYYVRDAQGNVMATYSEKKYEDGKIDLSLMEQHLYGSSRLGMRQVNELLVEKDEIKEFEPEYSSRNLGEKSYELTNHLGNVLAVVSDKKLANNEPDVKTAYDYFPFGMTMPNRTLSGDYRYGFGSHEKDFEVHEGWYGFGNYGYDARIGRRPGLDPIDLVGFSGYSVFRNNPLFFIDIDGKNPFPHIEDLPDYYFNKIVVEPVLNMIETASRLMGTVKVKVGISAGVGLGFKATKYVQGKFNLELAGADLTLNTGQSNISAMKLEGRATVGSKGGLDIEGNLSAVDIDFNNVQNILKLESPDLETFSFASADVKAQVTKLFETSGSMWAIQNKEGEWSFADGSYDIGVKQDVFEKTDISVDIKFGLKVAVGIDLKELYNLVGGGE
ncbi:MAG: hypothetical protein LBR52_02945, partial [Prevotellaceae bacterium]|nr:hypothetical protein [Prevotellaceae bacterium]